MAFICARQSTRLPGLGTLPPLKPVPEPRVTIGTPADDRQPHALGHLRRTPRKDHGLGPLLERGRPVEAVGNQILGLGQDAVAPDDGSESVDGGGGQRHVRDRCQDPSSKFQLPRHSQLPKPNGT